LPQIGRLAGNREVLRGGGPSLSRRGRVRKEDWGENPAPEVIRGKPVSLGETLFLPETTPCFWNTTFEI